MSVVTPIRPDIDAELVLTNKVIERKIEALIRACDAKGMAIMVTVIEDGEAVVFPNQHCYTDHLSMRGALDYSKEYLGVCAEETEIVDEGEK